MNITTAEWSVIRRALADAIRSAQRRDNLGPLAEYKPGAQEGWTAYDDKAVARNIDIARGVLAKLLANQWGVADMDHGIMLAKPTMAAAVREIGFATRYQRTRRGKLYEYVSAETDRSYGATVGRVRDLMAAGFELLPELKMPSDWAVDGDARV